MSSFERCGAERRTEIVDQVIVTVNQRVVCRRCDRLHVEKPDHGHVGGEGESARVAIVRKTALALVGTKTGFGAAVQQAVHRSDAFEFLGSHDPLEIAARPHLVEQHEELEMVAIPIEHRSHQLFDGIGSALGLLDRSLHLGRQLEPLAQQQLEQESFFAVEVVIQRRFREREFVGDGGEREARQPAAKHCFSSSVEDLGAGLVPSALVPGLSFGAGYALFL